MANIPAELRSLPLGHIIGSPLVAAIKAQALAAQTTVDFIKQVGLVSETNDGENLRAQNVDFKFDRVIEETVTQPANPTENVPAKITSYKVVPSQLTVPLLAIVPIPYIRINDMTIDFEFEIKDVDTKESTSTKNLNTSAKAGGWFWKVNASGSFTNRTTNKRETDRRTTLKITVNAVQDRIPEGLGRVLDILHDSIKVVPSGSATTEVAVPGPTG